MKNRAVIVGSRYHVPGDERRADLMRNPVRVMAIAEGYAMLNRVRDIDTPFCRPVYEVEKWRSA